ncbi:hypothetical protein ACS5NO_20805 [Larkinella sp. GY13]|uniref:hypothetical protein n=1 Tax=Larkinella sp. GY13 TaxID=3453720 RepID=UPI003EE956AA
MAIETYLVLALFRTQLEKVELDENFEINSVECNEVFKSFKTNLLEALKKDLTKVVYTELALRDVIFYPTDNYAQDLCYCYFRFAVPQEPDNFLVVRLLPFQNRVILHLKEPLNPVYSHKQLCRATFDKAEELADLL